MILFVHSKTENYFSLTLHRELCAIYADTKIKKYIYYETFDYFIQLCKPVIQTSISKRQWFLEVMYC